MLWEREELDDEPVFEGLTDLTSPRTFGKGLGALPLQARQGLPVTVVAAYDRLEAADHWAGGTWLFSMPVDDVLTYGVYLHYEGADVGKGYLEVFFADGDLIGAAQSHHPGILAWTDEPRA